MSGTKLLKRRRDKLFSENPYCYWCGCVVIHPETIERKETQPKNMATIDHLRDRLNSSRTEPNPNREIRTVLSCKDCNEKRSRESEKALPIEELRIRSKNHSKLKKKISE